MTAYFDADVAERPQQMWDAPASTTGREFVRYTALRSTYEFKLKVFDLSHQELESEWVNEPFEQEGSARSEPLNPYSSITLNFIKWGLIAFAVAILACVVAFVSGMTAVAVASLFSLFVSTVLIGEAQKRAKIERSSREAGRQSFGAR
jgi:hypothetical protein